MFLGTSEGSSEVSCTQSSDIQRHRHHYRNGIRDRRFLLLFILHWERSSSKLDKYPLFWGNKAVLSTFLSFPALFFLFFLIICILGFRVVPSSFYTSNIATTCPGFVLQMGRDLEQQSRRLATFPSFSGHYMFTTFSFGLFLSFLSGAFLG